MRGRAEFDMRWILLCLLVFNLLYFGWQFYLVPRDSGSRPVPAVDTVPAGQQGERLVLLKEVLTRTSQAAPPPSINRTVRHQVTVADEPAPVAEQAAPAVSPVAAAPEQPAEESSLQSESSSQDLSQQQPRQQSPQQPVLESLQAEPATVRNRLCAKIGPYDEAAMAEALVSGLEAEGVEPFVHADEVVYDLENWVLIPPLGSRAEALRMLRRLQSNKIDSYLITEGEFSNGISLGLFKQAASAQGVLARMTSAGYEAEIHQIERKKSRFWVGLSGEFEPAEMDQMLTQLVDDSEKINFSETLCEMFASTP